MTCVYSTLGTRGVSSGNPNVMASNKSPSWLLRVANNSNSSELVDVKPLDLFFKKPGGEILSREDYDKLTRDKAVCLRLLTRQPCRNLVGG